MSVNPLSDEWLDMILEQAHEGDVPTASEIIHLVAEIRVLRAKLNGEVPTNEGKEE